MRITQDRNQPADLTSVGQTEAQLAVRKKGDEKQLAAQQGDVIDISEEGRQKSAAMQQAADATAANGAASAEGAENEETGSRATSGDAANPAELEKKLQSKKTETRRKQQKLDAAKRQADGEPGNDSEVRKLKNDVRRLEQEEKKIKAEVYSS